MLPWGHLAVGYLCYSLYVRLRHHPFPEGTAVFALAIGTQFPDLVDKPLAWTLGVAPSGRSVGHSLVVAAILAAIVWMLVRRYGRSGEPIAVFISYLSHIVVDAAPAALAGNWE